MGRGVQQEMYDLCRTTSVLGGSIRWRQLFGYATFPGIAPQLYFLNIVSIATEALWSKWKLIDQKDKSYTFQGIRC